MLVLEPTTDLLEVALVFEMIVDSREREAPRVGLAEVVVVSSLCEIRTLFFDGAQSAGRTLDEAESVASRLEFASLIVLTDLDVGSDGSPPTVHMLEFLSRLSPGARIMSVGDAAGFSRVPVRLSRGRAHRLASSMGWQRELSTGSNSASHHPIGTFVFRDPRPFHPGRLSAALEMDLVVGRVGRILRSKGFVRLASRPERVGLWSTAGDVLRLDPTSMLSWDVESPLGQEIVFFGHNLDRSALADYLGSCLLTPDELEAGPATWATYRDDFPVWDAEHHH